jgi:hypothetical protein
MLQPVLGPFPISLRHHGISLLEHDIQRRELRYINGEHLFFLQFSPAPRLKKSFDITIREFLSLTKIFNLFLSIPTSICSSVTRLWPSQLC